MFYLETVVYDAICKDYSYLNPKAQLRNRNPSKVCSGRLGGVALADATADITTANQGGGGTGLHVRRGRWGCTAADDGGQTNV